MKTTGPRTWWRRLFSKKEEATATVKAELASPPEPTQAEMEERYADAIAKQAALASFRGDLGVPHYVDPDGDDAHEAVVLWANLTDAERTRRLMEYEGSFRLLKPRPWLEWAGLGSGSYIDWHRPGLWRWEDYEATDYLIYSSFKFTRHRLKAVNAMPLSVWRWLESRVEAA